MIIIIAILVVVLMLAVIAAIFALQNPAVTEVHFFSLLWEGPLAQFLIIAYGAGILTGILMMLPGSIRNSAQLMLARRKLDSIAKTVDAGKPAAPVPAPAVSVPVVSEKESDQ